MASNQVSLSARENLVLYSISNGKAGGVSTLKTFQEYVHLKLCQYFMVNSLYSQWSFWQKYLPCQKCTLPATNYCTSKEWYLPYRQLLIPILNLRVLSPHKRKQWTFLSTLRYGTCHYMQELFFVACTVPNLYSSFLSPKTPMIQIMHVC